jgi:cytochrome P450
MTLYSHLTGSTVEAGIPAEIAAVSSDTRGAVDPPIVKDVARKMAVDPINFLIEQGKQNPGCFRLQRDEKRNFIVISDVTMFEDVLTFDEFFGNPVTPNMSVNKNVFKIPVEQLEKYEQKAIGGLRQFILSNNNLLADEIVKILKPYLDDRMGDSGIMDLRDFGTNIFWPMTTALFGDGASIKNAPYLKKSFDEIDSNFGLALQGKKVPAVEENVNKAYQNFSKMLKESKNGGCPVGPIINYYDEATDHVDPDLTAKFATAAWWGGQGNTLPSTVWTFGMILADPRTRKLAYDEVDKGPFKNQPDSDGHFDYDTIPYLTAALKETLRMKTYSIAWRLVQKDCALKSKGAGKTFKFKKGDLIGLHFAMRHMDPSVHDKPEEFRPERFLGTGAGLSPTINGQQYAFAPFSAGRHKCAGYGLAMLEIPVVLAVCLSRYNMELLDPLPGMNFLEAFGVVGPDSKPCRIKYQRRF